MIDSGQNQINLWDSLVLTAQVMKQRDTEATEEEAEEKLNSTERPSRSYYGFFCPVGDFRRLLSQYALMDQNLFLWSLNWLEIYFFGEDTNSLKKLSPDATINEATLLLIAFKLTRQQNRSVEFRNFKKTPNSKHFGSLIATMFSLPSHKELAEAAVEGHLNFTNHRLANNNNTKKKADDTEDDQNTKKKLMLAKFEELWNMISVLHPQLQQYREEISMEDVCLPIAREQTDTKKGGRHKKGEENDSKGEDKIPLQTPREQGPTIAKKSSVSDQDIIAIETTSLAKKVQKDNIEKGLKLGEKSNEDDVLDDDNDDDEDFVAGAGKQDKKSKKKKNKNKKNKQRHQSPGKLQDQHKEEKSTKRKLSSEENLEGGKKGQGNEGGRGEEEQQEEEDKDETEQEKTAKVIVYEDSKAQKQAKKTKIEPQEASDTLIEFLPEYKPAPESDLLLEKFVELFQKLAEVIAKQKPDIIANLKSKKIDQEEEKK